MRLFRSVSLVAVLAGATLVGSSPALARHGHGRVFISGGWYWGCPGPWGCGYAYGPPYPSAPPNYALVDTDVSPEEARVILDGEDLGQADDFDGFPGYLTVSPGKHVLEFRRAGYRPLRIQLQARAGQYYDIDRKLKRGESVETDELGERPRVSSPRRPTSSQHHGTDESERAPRDRSWGADEDEDENEGIPPGEPGSGPDAAPDRGSERRRSEESGTARLVLRLRPDDSAVYIDGKLLGAGDGLAGADGVTVDVGRHTLEVVKPGYAPYRTTLVLRDGEVRNVSVRLERSRN